MEIIEEAHPTVGLLRPRTTGNPKLKEVDPEVFVQGFPRLVQSPYQPLVFGPEELSTVLLLKPHLNGNVLKYRGNYYLAPPENPYHYVGLKKPIGHLPLPIPCLFSRPQSLEKMQAIADAFDQEVELV